MPRVPCIRVSCDRPAPRLLHRGSGPGEPQKYQYYSLWEKVTKLEAQRHLRSSAASHLDHLPGPGGLPWCGTGATRCKLRAGEMGKTPAGTGAGTCRLGSSALLSPPVLEGPCGPSWAEELRAQRVRRWWHQVGLGRQDGDHAAGCWLHSGQRLEPVAVRVGNAHWYRPRSQLLRQDLNHPSRAGAGRGREGRGSGNGAKGTGRGWGSVGNDLWDRVPREAAEHVQALAVAPVQVQAEDRWEDKQSRQSCSPPLWLPAGWTGGAQNLGEALA